MRQGIRNFHASWVIGIVLFVIGIVGLIFSEKHDQKERAEKMAQEEAEERAALERAKEDGSC